MPRAYRLFKARQGLTVENLRLSKAAGGMEQLTERDAGICKLQFVQSG